MELHQVRYFLSLSKTLNFTRASEECHVSQPALSRAIKQLEAELGGELFRRERSLTHMTDLGRHVFPALQQCFESSRSARNLAEEFRRSGHAPLNLALASAVEMDLVSPILGEIASGFPRIEMNIFRGPPHEIAEKMKSGDVELAVAEPLGDGWERFEAKKLYEEKFGLLMNKINPLTKNNNIGIEHLSDVRLLCRPHCAMTDLLVQKFRDAGVQSPQRHEVPLLEDMAGMVRANLGVAIWPSSRQISPDMKLGEIDGVKMSSWVHLYSVFGRRQSTAASTFARLMRAKDWSILDGASERSIQVPMQEGGTVH